MRRTIEVINIACVVAFFLATARAGAPDETEPGSHDLEQLAPEAQQIVERAIDGQRIKILCDSGMEGVKAAVRQATIRLIFSGEVDSPRASGTAAGRYIVSRCRDIDPDF